MPRTKKPVPAGRRNPFADSSDRALAGNAPYLRNITRRIGVVLQREGLHGAVSAHITVLVRQNGTRWPQGAGGINETFRF
jgi:hypothetical protein